MATKQPKESKDKKKITYNKPRDDKNNLQKRINQLQKELNEKNDKLLRSYADIQNIQKRMEKEIKSREEEIKKKYISELLDLNELLKKAYEDKNPKEGLKLILNNLENFFEKEQVTYIDCLGKQFDHNFHHALSTIETEEHEDGKIVEEIKKGYMINGKLLRPSQVIVAKKKEKKEAE